MGLLQVSTGAACGRCPLADTHARVSVPQFSCFAFELLVLLCYCLLAFISSHHSGCRGNESAGHSDHSLRTGAAPCEVMQASQTEVIAAHWSLGPCGDFLGLLLLNSGEK